LELGLDIAHRANENQRVRRAALSIAGGRERVKIAGRSKLRIRVSRPLEGPEAAIGGLRRRAREAPVAAVRVVVREAALVEAREQRLAALLDQQQHAVGLAAIRRAAGHRDVVTIADADAARRLGAAEEGLRAAHQLAAA